MLIGDTKAMLAAANEKRRADAQAKGLLFYIREGFFGSFYIIRFRDELEMWPAQQTEESAMARQLQLHKELAAAIERDLQKAERKSHAR